MFTGVSESFAGRGYRGEESCFDGVLPLLRLISGD